MIVIWIWLLPRDQKLGRFLAAFGKLSQLSILAKILPYQNFSGIKSMIFSKRDIRTTYIPKIRKIHSSVWKLKAKNLQKFKFWPKNGQILATNAQILAISDFPGIYTMIFSKKTTRVVSIPKIMKIYIGVLKM